RRRACRIARQRIHGTAGQAGGRRSRQGGEAAGPGYGATVAQTAGRTIAGRCRRACLCDRARAQRAGPRAAAHRGRARPPRPSALMAPRLRRRPAAVIFDMDGLLLDTEPLAARAWNEAAAALGVEFDEALALAMVGRNFSDCAAMVRARYGASYPVDALLDRWHAAYDAIVAQDGVTVKPGAIALVDWLE